MLLTKLKKKFYLVHCQSPFPLNNLLKPFYTRLMKSFGRKWEFLSKNFAKKGLLKAKQR